MTAYTPPREPVRILTAPVAAVTGATVTIGAHPGVPVYGPMPGVGAKVLVLEQGPSLIVLGRALSLTDLEAIIQPLTARIEALEAQLGGS